MACLLITVARPCSCNLAIFTRKLCSMGLGNKLLFFFSSLGAFNGLIAGIYYIGFAAKKNLSNYFLGGLLLALGIRIAKSVAFFFDYMVPRSLLQVGLTACVFIGPCLYFFVKAELTQARKLPKSWGMQLITWAFLIVVAGLIIPYERFPFLWGQRIIPIIYTQWGVYVVMSIIALVPVIKKIGSKEKLKTFEKWVLSVAGSVSIIFLAYVWAYLNILPGSYIIGPLYFSLVLYMVIFTLLYRKKASDLSSFSQPAKEEKKMPAEDVKYLLGKLEKAMTEKQLFKNPDLKLNDLAKEIQLSGHQLSRLLNEYVGKSFTSFVNEYRIEEACHLLLTEKNFTIDAISFEAGFNSKSVFFTSFKKHKGMTPSAFQQAGHPDL